MRNRKYIRPSESSKNLEHMTKNMEVVFDTNLQYKLDNCKQEPDAWNLSTTTASPLASCFKGRETNKTKRVHFDGTLFAARAELKRLRSSDTARITDKTASWRPATDATSAAGSIEYYTVSTA